MKIIHIHHHYWPVVGGLENVVKALAEGMTRLGHEVHVITSRYGAEDRPGEEIINGEAGIHGTPSVITGNGGQVEVAPPGLVSLWAEPRPEKYGEAILTLLTDKSLRKN
jgi:glycosyltransferase involved in cell wall biosynthesis